MAVSPFISSSHPQVESPMGVATGTEPSQACEHWDRNIWAGNRIYAQLTGLIWTQRGTLSSLQYPAPAPPSPPPSSLSPSLLPLPPHAEKLIDPLCPGSRVSSVRIIPPGIGFPLLPCSWEPRSCPFLIHSASTSQWHWAPQQPLCVIFFFFFFLGRGRKWKGCSRKV